MIPYPKRSPNIGDTDPFTKQENIDKITVHLFFDNRLHNLSWLLMMLSTFLQSSFLSLRLISLLLEIRLALLGNLSLIVSIIIVNYFLMMII